VTETRQGSICIDYTGFSPSSQLITPEFTSCEKKPTADKTFLSSLSTLRVECAKDGRAI